MTAQPIYQVLIVEDDPHPRAYFANCVNGHAQLRLLGEAASVAQGKALMEQSVCKLMPCSPISACPMAAAWN
ncbi:MAG: hypothetical protein ACKO1L_12770 [Brachymonas sp.]